VEEELPNIPSLQYNPGRFQKLKAAILAAIEADSSCETYFSHQQKCLLNIVNNIDTSPFGYVDMATGTGKTKVFNVLSLYQFLLGDGNIYIIEPTQDLVTQTTRTLQQLLRLEEFSSIKTGDIIGISTLNVPVEEFKKYHHQNKKIIVICRESFEILLKTINMKNTSAVHVDEFHVMPKRFLHLLKYHVHTYGFLAYAYSATPDAKNRWDFFEKNLVFQYSIEEGLRDGYLTPWVAERVSFDLNEDGYADFINTHANPAKKQTLVEGKGIIYVKGTIEASQLAGDLQKKGFKARAVHSLMKDNAKTIDLFINSQDVNILIAVDMLKMGFDASIDWLLIAKDINSPNDFIQMAGRAIRGGIQFTRKKGLPDKKAYIMAHQSFNIPETVFFPCIETPEASSYPQQSEFVKMMRGVQEPEFNLDDFIRSLQEGDTHAAPQQGEFGLDFTEQADAAEAGPSQRRVITETFQQQLVTPYPELDLELEDPSEFVKMMRGVQEPEFDLEDFIRSLQGGDSHAASQQAEFELDFTEQADAAEAGPSQRQVITETFQQQLVTPYPELELEDPLNHPLFDFNFDSF